jgi:hypothetical protein
MISVLLLTMAAGFVSNGYQKVYAADDNPSQDTLGTQIRESVNNQIIKELFPSSPIKHLVEITLSGFPHQTSESDTKVDLTCLEITVTIACTGSSNIIIPGMETPLE